MEQNVTSDLTSRFADAVSHPQIFVGAIFVVVAMCALAFFGKRRALFFVLAITFPLSGSVWVSVDTYSTLLRWFVLGLMALTVFRLRVSPGKAWVFFAAYLLLSIGFGLLVSPGASTIQYAILYISLALGIASLAEDMKSTKQITKIFLLFLAPALIWTFLSLSNFSNLGRNTAGFAMRFSGGGTAAPLYVMTGGICLPFVVWGAMRSTSMHWRIALGLIVPLMVFFLVASGQRTGTFAGVLGCMPLLMRRKFGKMFAVGVLVAICAGSIWLIQSVNQDQSDFVAQRMLNTSTTGRYEIWEILLTEYILPNPFIGHGPASSRGLKALVGLGTHNSYLAIWYDSSIFGLLLLLTVIAIAYWRSGMLILFAADSESRELGRLCLGILMATTSSGLFEASLAAPSTIVSVTFLLAVVAAERLHALNSTQAIVRNHQRSLMLKLGPRRIRRFPLT